MSNIHTYGPVLHALTDRAVSDLGHYVEKIERAQDRFWSPDCLRMIQMRNDAKALRALADRIDAEHARMTAQVEAA